MGKSKPIGIRGKYIGDFSNLNCEAARCRTVAGLGFLLIGDLIEYSLHRSIESIIQTWVLRMAMATILNSYQPFTLRGRSLVAFFPQGNMCMGAGAQIMAFASQKSEKKVKNDGKTSKNRTLQGKNHTLKDSDDSPGKLSAGDVVCNTSTESFIGNTAENSPVSSAPRSVVLQSCISTSVSLLAFGALVRQVSHIASMEGWAIHDASAEVSFCFETWHIELIIGLVILITSCRLLLLRTWRDFADSSEAANQQVLGLLHPLDYVVISFLPGISEELLFRGALLPLFGLTWESALATGAVFGCLHLGSGRKYSFALWATFVGFAYGLATIMSSSVIVPIASHSLNNLLGGIFWRYMSTPQKKL